jgi:hypothetical protein
MGLRMAIASALAAVSQSGFAADQLKINVGASLISHSNAALDKGDKQSDTERVAHAAVDYSHPDDGFLLADLGYVVDRRDFQRNVQSDQTAVDGKADFLVHLLPRRLDLVLDHQISESLTDRRNVDVTDNQERRSIITAGVDGYAHLSAVDSLVLRPRYTDVSFESSTDSDSQRSFVTGAWQHLLSPVSSTELNVSWGKVKFDQSINDYESTGAQLSYKTALTRLSYELAGGFTRIDRDHGDSVNGYQARLNADYKGDGYTWGGTLVHELTDTSVGLSQTELSVTNFNAADSNFDQQDIIKRTQADIFASRQFNAANTVSVGIGYRKDDYDTLPEDQDGYYAQFNYQYSLNSFWSLGVDARYEKTRFLNSIDQLEYREITPEVFAIYRVTERFSIRGAVARRDRKANVASAEYTDNQALITVNYRLY